MSNSEQNNDSVIQKNGRIYMKLSDGRYWCPSRQFRDGSPTRRTLKNTEINSQTSSRQSNFFPKQLTFNAVDFETATTDRFICQVGIVSVKDGVIVEKVSMLIQPPGNRYDTNTIMVHHITPKDTENSMTFKEAWCDLKKYFQNTLVVAHNSAFDEDVLRKNLKYYGILDSEISPFLCTCQLYKHLAYSKGIDIKAGLKDLCLAFNLSYDNHHDALFDSDCCANFYLNYVNGIEPDYSLIEKNETIHPQQ